MFTTGGSIRVAGDQQILVLGNLISGREPRGNVLIVPPFGKSARDLFIFTCYLWNAGFNVFRFDARNHVGLSSGDIDHFTLSSLQRDLQIVMDALNKRGYDDLMLFGISLSVPVVLKHAAIRRGVRGIVSVIGAVDVQFAIETASGSRADAYRRQERGRAPTHNILGFDVLADDFVRDMDEADFAPLESIVGAARNAGCPIHTVMAMDDEWVPRDRVLRTHEASPDGSTLTAFEGVSHEFGRSVQTTKRICMDVCRLCGLIVGDGEPAWQVPNFADVLRESTAEASSFDVLARRVFSLDALTDLETIA